MDRKKLIYILSGIMGGIILIIAIVFIIINLVGKKTLSYVKIENELITAAQNYYENNEDMLPKENGNSVNLEESTLVDENYIKPINTMISEGVSCTAKVIVTKNGDYYLYTPMLNCGDEYKSKKFIDVVLADNPIVSTGDGLYKEKNKLVFKGEYINNYVSLNNKLWIIIDIDQDGYARLMYDDKRVKDTYVWDDRYNILKDDYVGINNYEISRMKEILLLLENDQEYISEDIKGRLAYRNFCIGKRSSNNIAKNNDEECATVINNQLIGLPYVSDFINASIDPNCKDIDSPSCSNYNYLANIGASSYTMTGNKEKSEKVYFVSSSNYSTINAVNEKVLRPVIFISNNNLYESGSGTIDDPYTLK